jgi:stalled ribosome alternative rescue factor ArfA
MKKKLKKIGEMTKTRQVWNFNAATKVKQNDKGKGSYNRQKFKNNVS